jgi:hypothetical protein
MGFSLHKAASDILQLISYLPRQSLPQDCHRFVVCLDISGSCRVVLCHTRHVRGVSERSQLAQFASNMRYPSSLILQTACMPASIGLADLACQSDAYCHKPQFFWSIVCNETCAKVTMTMPEKSQ